MAHVRAFGVAGLLLTLAVASPASAQVEVGLGVPFSASDLEVALATRGGVIDVTVTALTPSTVEVVTATTSVRIDLGGTRGPAAARLLAMQLLEVSPPGLAAEVPARVERATAVTPRRAGDPALLVAIGGGRGVRGVDMTMTRVRLEATTTAAGFRVGAGAGWVHGLADAVDPTQPVGADLAIVGPLIGRELGALQLVAGPIGGRYRVTGASGWLWGVTATARVRVARTGGWHVWVGADAELLDPRVVVRFDGREVAATPRAALYGELAIAWGPP
jgi:hypothetical protein